MSKSSDHNDFLPARALASLREMAQGLALARARRRESLRGWAARLGVSVRTVQRMEAGDPGVGMGVYLAALWLIGRSDALATLVDPSKDEEALEFDLRRAKSRLKKSGGAFG